MNKLNFNKSLTDQKRSSRDFGQLNLIFLTSGDLSPVCMIDGTVGQLCPDMDDLFSLQRNKKGGSYDLYRGLYLIE